MKPPGTDAKKEKRYRFDPNRVVIIGLDTDDGPEHPLWDLRSFNAIDDDLVRNILARGVLTPILCRVVDGRAEVINGRQRVKNSREALKRQVEAGIPEDQWIRVKADVIEASDADLVAMKRVTNLSQPDEVLDKARDAVRLLSYGRDEAEIAIDLKIDPETVRRYVALTQADPSVLEAISAGKIAPTAALQLAKLPHAEQRAALKDLLALEHAPTVVEARRIANRKAGRAEGVGVSRKVIRRMRHHLAGQEASDEFNEGFAAALDVVLGTGEVHAKAAPLIEVATKKQIPKKTGGGG